MFNRKKSLKRWVAQHNSQIKAINHVYEILADTKANKINLINKNGPIQYYDYIEGLHEAIYVKLRAHEAHRLDRLLMEIPARQKFFMCLLAWAERKAKKQTFSIKNDAVQLKFKTI
jgi:hypothetical protein